MNEDSDPKSNVASPVFVEDLFLTDVFLIKGRLANKNRRLTNTLEDYRRQYLTIEDATLVSLRNQEVIKTPTVRVNVDELILAHELVDVAGDPTFRQLAAGGSAPQNRIRAFYNGAVQFEVSGTIESGAYESQGISGRRYFIMKKPIVRGMDLDRQELRILKNLDYAILRKDRMAYVYDFG
ncbi:MAG: hypothetical protein R3F29_12500 [Planctomycetota bacterium]